MEENSQEAFGMRIAWFTPFAQNSAIGMVSKQICEEIVKTSDVDIWVPQTEGRILTNVNVIEFHGKKDLIKLNAYDFIIYNIANFAGFHREIYDVALQYPGIIIFHDQTMNNFFGQYYVFPEFGGDNSEAGYAAYASFLEKYCGDAVVEDLHKGIRDGFFPIYEYGMIPDYHLLEPVLENAKGVFTHARFFCDEIKKIYNYPVSFSYLPCSRENQTECNDKVICEIVENARKNNKKILLSNGIVHHVKQIDKVVDVLLDDVELSQHLVYIVIGSYGGEYGDRLAEISKGKLKNCLFMMNYQPYEVMNYALENADICINLRYPNSEVCSLSLLEQMSYGKPVLVINSGIYGEMPDGAVLKIDYTDLHYGIKKVLQTLIDGEDISDYGKNAKEFIEKYCTVGVYCDKLLSFLNSLKGDQCIKKLQNKSLESVCNVMRKLGINDYSAPATVGRIVNEMTKMFNSCEGNKRTVKTIGIWSAFYYEIPNLAREGISRFMGNMISAVVKRYSVCVEAWCYSFNEAEVRKMFSEVPEDRIKFITEKSWKEIFEVGYDVVDYVGEVDAERDNLNVAARRVSQADIMLPLIIYLDSVIGTDKKVFVPAHDMAVSYHFDEFITNDKTYKSRQTDILVRADNLARNNAFFLTISNSVRQKQILKFIRGLTPEQTEFVYLPVMIPSDIEGKIITESELREKFGISGNYFFYPTQIRPYKNFQTLFKAMNILKKREKDISLVITGNPDDVPEVSGILKDLGIADRIIRLNSISEIYLYSFYKYAAAVPVPSLFEGGFPLQACEALAMGTPIVLADIDVVEERIEACGFNLGNCGLNIFDPFNEKELADRLEKILSQREQTVSRQQPFAEKLLSYTWSDAAEKYYRIFCMR